MNPENNEPINIISGAKLLKKLKANKNFTIFSLRISAVKQVVFQRLTKLGEKAWRTPSELGIRN